MSVVSVMCYPIDRCLCDGLITRPEESYLVCVCVCVCVCLRMGLHEATLHATRQRVQSPTIERAVSKLAMPMTRKNDKAW